MTGSFFVPIPHYPIVFGLDTQLYIFTSTPAFFCPLNVTENWRRLADTAGAAPTAGEVCHRQGVRHLTHESQTGITILPEIKIRFVHPLFSYIGG